MRVRSGITAQICEFSVGFLFLLENSYHSSLQRRIEDFERVGICVFAHRHYSRAGAG